jgi:hypothetical protein
MRLLAVSILSLVVAGCAVVAPSSAPSRSPADPSTAALERPLALPTFGGGCQPSAAHSVLPDLADGLGPGPVWPVGLEPPGASLGAAKDGVWHAVKVLWTAAPSYTGPILIRGARIDGPGTIRFSLDGGATQTDELYLPPGGPDPREEGWPSFTFVQAAGCYAYQVDGSSFSYSVEFALAN